MAAYVLRRLLSVLLVLVAVSMLVFAILLTFATRMRRDLAAHKRLMILLTVCLLDPGNTLDIMLLSRRGQSIRFPKGGPKGAPVYGRSARGNIGSGRLRAAAAMRPRASRCSASTHIASHWAASSGPPSMRRTTSMRLRKGRPPRRASSGKSGPAPI